MARATRSRAATAATPSSSTRRSRRAMSTRSPISRCRTTFSTWTTPCSPGSPPARSRPAPSTSGPTRRRPMTASSTTAPPACSCSTQTAALPAARPASPPAIPASPSPTRISSWCEAVAARALASNLTASERAVQVFAPSPLAGSLQNGEKPEQCSEFDSDWFSVRFSQILVRSKFCNNPVAGEGMNGSSTSSDWARGFLRKRFLTNPSPIRMC